MPMKHDEEIIRLGAKAVVAAANAFSELWVQETRSLRAPTMKEYHSILATLGMARDAFRILKEEQEDGHE